MKLAFRLLLILLPLGGMAQTPQDSLRVLWVGNSFSYCNDLPGMVQKIASTQKVKLSCTRFLKGGERFSGHLKNKKLLQAIADGGWDYVVLQEQSTAPAMPTGQVAREVYPAARTLDSLVHAASPDARVIFYMTWGHKYGNRKPVAEYPLSNGYEGMQERLKTSYLEMAYDNGAWCAPVGMAWRAVRSERPLHPLPARLLPPRGSGQLSGCQRHFHDDPPASLPDGFHRGASGRAGRISPAYGPANCARQPRAAEYPVGRLVYRLFFSIFVGSTNADQPE